MIQLHTIIKTDDPETLHAELEALLDSCQENEYKDFNDICQIALKLKNSIPNAFRIVRLVLASPISSASGERSFSKLKLLFEALRTTIGDDRYDFLKLLFSKKDSTDEISIEDIVNEWSKLKLRRINM